MGYTSPYFQYDGLEGVKWTFATENILFAVSGLRGIVLIRGLDNNSPSSAVRWDAEQWSPALLGKNNRETFRLSHVEGADASGEVRYMHRNPVVRRLVLQAEQWRWSSFRHEANGQAGLVLAMRNKRGK